MIAIVALKLPSVFLRFIDLRTSKLVFNGPFQGRGQFRHMLSSERRIAYPIEMAFRGKIKSTSSVEFIHFHWLLVVRNNLASHEVGPLELIIA